MADELKVLLREHYRDLRDGTIVLLDTSMEKCHEANLASLEILVKERGFGGIIVDLNRPFSHHSKILGENNISMEGLFFIDTVSKSVGAKMIENNTVQYLEGPSFLTAISIAVEEAMKILNREKNFLLLDSISTLANYNSHNSVAKFSHHLVSKMRATNLSGLLIAVDRQMYPEIYSTLAEVCDKIVKI